MTKYKKLRRMCKICGEMFTPIGKFSRICPNCSKSPGKAMNDLIKVQTHVNHTLKARKSLSNNEI